MYSYNYPLLYMWLFVMIEYIYYSLFNALDDEFSCTAI